MHLETLNQEEAISETSPKEKTPLITRYFFHTILITTLVCTIIFFLCLLLIWQNTSNFNISSLSLNRYIDKTHGYSMSYPYSWVKSATQNGTVLTNNTDYTLIFRSGNSANILTNNAISFTKYTKIKTIHIIFMGIQTDNTIVYIPYSQQYIQDKVAPEVFFLQGKYYSCELQTTHGQTIPESIQEQAATIITTLFFNNSGK